MKTISIQASLKRGWTLFKGHKATLIISLVVLMILQMMTRSNKGGLLYHHDSLIRILVAVIAWVAVTIVKIGWLKLTLMIEDGESPKWTEVFSHADHFIRFIIGSLIYAIGTGLLMILLIVPGIYFAITYSFVPLLIIDKNMGIGEAFAKSGEMTRGHKWKIFGLVLATIGLTILGALVFLVGLLVVIPVCALAYAHVYRTLLKHAPHHAASEAPEMAL